MEDGLFGTEDCPSRDIGRRKLGWDPEQPHGIRQQGTPKEGQGLCHRREGKEDEVVGRGLWDINRNPKHGDTILKPQHAEVEAGLSSLRLMSISAAWTPL